MVYSIGIIGGLGPEAGTFFANQIVEISQKHHGAGVSKPSPDFTLRSPSVPDYVARLRDRDSALSVLLPEVKILEDIGADFIAIACNTAHLWYDDVADAASVPVLDIRREALKAIKADGHNTVGLLAAATTIRERLYQQVQGEYSIEVISTDNIRGLQSLLERVARGELSEQDKSELLERADALKSQGVEAIVLACTEIPLLVKPDEFPLPAYDAGHILAMVATDIAYGKIELPSKNSLYKTN